MSRIKSPRQKKAASLKRDRRNTYGESPHGARKNIRRRKAWLHREERRVASQALAAASGPPDADKLAGMEDRATVESGTVRRTGFRKKPDEPLGQVLKKKRGRPTG